jgi:hypothetical protein
MKGCWKEQGGTRRAVGCRLFSVPALPLADLQRVHLSAKLEDILRHVYVTVFKCMWAMEWQQFGSLKPVTTPLPALQLSSDSHCVCPMLHSYIRYLCFVFGIARVGSNVLSRICCICSVRLITLCADVHVTKTPWLSDTGGGGWLRRDGQGRGAESCCRNSVAHAVCDVIQLLVLWEQRYTIFCCMKIWKVGEFWALGWE